MKLQLHRSKQKPDWLLVATPERNKWQRLAAATSGIATPANLLTVLGVVLVGYGIFLLPLQILAGVACIIIGRLFDLLDGIVANATGTKSPLGEMVDAAADKVVLFGTGIAIGSLGLVSWPIIVLLFLQNTANVAVSYSARKRHITLHPSTIGKVATALQWAGIIGLIAAHALPAVQLLAYIIILVGLIAGAIATGSYIRTAYRSR